MTNRVIRNCSQVDHGVEALELIRLDVPDVAAATLVLSRWRSEVAGLVPLGIQSEDLVAMPP